MKYIVLFLLVGLVVSQQCYNCANNQCINNQCLSCIEGFLIDTSGSCGRYTPIEGCRIYDQNNGGCNSCFPGYLLQYGRCQQLIANCNYSITNNTDLCTVCNNTYVVVDDIHCYSNQANSCPMGTLPRKLNNSQSFCQKFQIQKCSEPDPNINYCKVCMNNFFNLNGVCNNLVSQTSCPNNSCSCQNYYFNNVCYQFNLQGCLSSSDKLYCDLCNDTLVSVSGRCAEPVKIADIHCNVLQLNSNICTGCNFNYLLDPNNICVKSFSFCSDPSRSCQAQCSSPYLLYYNGQCYIKDPQCIAYDQVNMKCTKCYEGYTLNSSNLCQKTQRCLIYSSVYTNNKRTCSKCFTGYQLNSNTLNCDTLPSNCQQMNSAGKCTACSSYTNLIVQQLANGESYPSNLSITVNTTVCVYTTSNCQYYNTFGYCQICQSGYVQIQHQCIAVATNCLVPLDSDKSKCQTCSPAYTLDSSSQTCYPRIQGCQTYASSNVCSKCNTGYALRNSICFYLDSNCLEYAPSGNCIRCGNSLVPFYSTCVYYDPYCYQYDSNGFCTGSFGGFSRSQAFNTLLQINYRSYIAYVRNIQGSSSSSSGSGSGSGSGSSGTSTEVSIYGGYYTVAGVIRVLPTVGLYNERISQYNVNGKIRSCRNGYILYNDMCVIKIDNCAQYASSNGLCIKCNSYYHMGPGRTCVALSSAICSIPTSNGQYCSKCGSDYTLVNGQCYYSRLNVVDFTSTSSNQIKTVQTGYFIYQKYNIAWPNDENCISQTQPGRCSQCLQQSTYTQKGMRNIDGLCVLVQDKCASYNARGICQTCINGYNLYFGQCYANNCLTQNLIDGVCSTCPYLFTYEAGLCINKNQSNCLVYNQITSYNTSIKSVSCQFCLTGYYLKTDNTCAQMISNCEVTDSQTGRCTQCVSTYTIYQDQCIKQISGCQIYNSSNSYQTCTTCLLSYTLINNQCFALPFRCLQLSNTTGYCSKCQTGYNPIVQSGQSICIYNVTHCNIYNLQGRCTICDVNYVLQNNLCNFFVVGCKTLVNGTNSIYCQECLAGYILINGFCISDPNCNSIDSNGKCLTCISGYRLINGVCTKNTIDNCLTQTNDDCLECISGFVKITLYGQVYCILQRIVYSGCQTQQYPCPSCQPGFELRDDGFCYAIKCLDASLTRFSMRTCSNCYPYYKIDPTSRFCILYNCNSQSCYTSTQVPPGFISTNRTGFLIYIKYCTALQDDYSCRTCSNYRYPNLLIQWNLCYPSNCKNLNLYDCNGSCYNYFSNNIINDSTVCTADNCQSYNSDGTCLICINPYIVNNGICLYQGPCSSYDPITSQCKQCKSNYFLDSGKCYVMNCTSYSPTDVSICLQCASGFQLTQNKTCQLKYCIYPYQNYPCTQCRAGFYWNTATRLCQMNNCQVFDYTKDVCINCVTFYNLHALGYCYPDYCSNFDPTVYQCLNCSSGYILNSQGICVINNCCSFNDRVCTYCCTGYDYVNGICRSRCDQFNSAGVCIACKAGYKLSNNTCVSEITGCITYSGAVCTACQSGLKLLNGICIPMYCNQYTQTNPTNCIQCMPRFYRLNSSGLCYPKNCISFNSTNWMCLACESSTNYRFNLISSEGLCFTDYCRTYNVSNYVCASCLANTSYANQYQLQTLNNSQVCLLTCGAYYELINFVCQLKYCAKFSSTGQCATCLPGYDLDASTGYCRIKYCLNYNGENCQTCMAGFTLDSVNKKYCVPINCLNYNFGSNICLDCLDGYVRQYNLCILKDCYLYDGQYLCTKCMDGFQLVTQNGVLICQKIYNSTCSDGYYYSTQRGGCVQIPIDYCRYVNPNTPNICLVCLPNYYLFNNTCYSVSGCDQYQISYIYGCKSCIQGFKLQGNLCIRDLCQQYYTNLTCKTCAANYFLYNGVCVYYQDFCLIGNTFSGCITCQPRYQSVNGLCKKLPNNCQLMDASLSCTQCLSGYLLFNGICCLQIPNCQVQNGSYCVQCNTSYALSADRLSCVSKTPIRYCIQYDSTYQYCLVCQDGFDITPNRKCLAANCTKYDIQTYICSQCANKTSNGVSYFFTLTNQRCYLINLDFCNVPVDSTRCKTCISGFTATVDGLCRADNCQIYKSNQKECSTCLAGYYLTSLNICNKSPDNCQVVNSLNGLCTVCLSGYTLTANGLCVKGTVFCDQYNSVTGKCLTCKSGYYLTSSQTCLSLPINCLVANNLGICQQCIGNYILSNSGVCYLLIPNCASYNDLGNCINCNNGYYLNLNSTCQILPNNCILATIYGVCRQCLTGYKLDSGLCVKQIPNCGNYFNNTCVSCVDGYYLVNSICYPLNPNCITLNSNLQCVKCQNGYVLYLGLCYLNISNCLNFSQTGDCSQCSSGYYVNLNGRCDVIPTNCSRVGSSGVCIQCVSGYTIQNGICYLQISNCYAYELATSICRQCVAGYYLINGLCYKLPDNCLTVTQNNICLTCTSGYFIQNGICYIALPNCQLYTSNGLCSKCVSGYYLPAGSNVCTLNPDGCSRLDANNQGCISCIDGYALQNGYCYRIVINCTLYDQSTKICQQCNSNYFLYNGVCYELPPNCLAVNAQRQCSLCQNGYILQNGICYKQIVYCLTYSNSGCIQCQTGYYINSQGVCSANPTNCNSVAQNGSCISCISGYLLQNGICYKFDPNCIAYDLATTVCKSCTSGYYLNSQYSCTILPTNCSTANIAGTCLSCITGYTLSNGICYLSIPNCIAYNSTTQSCIQCASGYNLTNGYCYKYIANCSLYSQQTYNCIKCQDGFILSNNLCVICGDGYYIDSYGQCKQNPSLCKIANQYGYCLNCQLGYVLNNGVCTLEITYCQNYSTNSAGQTICAQCLTGFYLKDSQTCVRLPTGCSAAYSNGTCYQCNTGYQLNANGICYTSVLNCQAYQLSTGICLQCIANYYLTINQTCTKINTDYCQFANSLGQCLQCYSGYVLINSNCFPVLPYCKTHSTTSYICLECVQNYYLYNNTCSRMPNGCLAMNGDKCITCMQGYNLTSNGLCQLIDNSSCIQYNALNNQCLQCRAGYYLTSNYLCIKLPDNCINATSQGVCVSCISGYTLSNNGICYKNIDNCQQYNTNTGSCIQCINSYYLSNGLCYRYPDNCQSFDATSLSCLQCITGYTLANGQCIINTPTNCLVTNPSNSNQCWTCKAGFYEYWVNSNGSAITSLVPISQYCKPYPEYCTNVDLLGNCISCCFGSQLQNGKCIGTTNRSLNCDSFDSINLKCLKCSTGYSYCDSLAICIQMNTNCLTYNSAQQCIQCINGFVLFNGQCVRLPPGVSATNSQVCNTGYTYATITQYGNSGSGCFRNKNELRKISSMSSVTFQGTYLQSPQSYLTLSSNNLNSNAWVAPPYLNNYLSVKFTSAQIIHYIQTQGGSSGYVTDYILHFKNKDGAPFICWNSCQKITGNTNNSDVAELKLPQPIVATQIRIYPLKWINGIAMTLDMLVEIQ